MDDHFLTDAQKTLRQRARQVAESALMPIARQADEDNIFCRANLDAVAEAGFMSLIIPAKFGGGGGSEKDNVIMKEEVSRASTSAASLIENHNMATHALMASGSDRQKQDLLPKFAVCEVLSTLAITEPEAGSDVRAIRARAERVSGGYRINAHKRYVSLADIAGIVMVLAKTNPDPASNDMGLFLVDRDTPGFRIGEKQEKMGQRALVTADIVLEDCVVPAEALLGEPNDGFKTIVAALNRARISMGAQAVGIARAAFEEALAHAKTRHTFGKPLKDHQALGFGLADMAIEIDAARLMVHHAADLFDAGADYLTAGAKAKLFASEMSNRVVDKALQIFGGQGFFKDCPIERYYRDQRVIELYGGSSEMMRNTILRFL